MSLPPAPSNLTPGLSLAAGSMPLTSTSGLDPLTLAPQVGNTKARLPTAALGMGSFGRSGGASSTPADFQGATPGVLYGDLASVLPPLSAALSADTSTSFTASALSSNSASDSALNTGTADIMGQLPQSFSRITGYALPFLPAAFPTGTNSSTSSGAAPSYTRGTFDATSNSASSALTRSHSPNSVLDIRAGSRLMTPALFRGGNFGGDGGGGSGSLLPNANSPLDLTSASSGSAAADPSNGLSSLVRDHSVVDTKTNTPRTGLGTDSQVPLSPLKFTLSDLGDMLKTQGSPARAELFPASTSSSSSRTIASSDASVKSDDEDGDSGAFLCTQFLILILLCERFS